MSVAGGALVCMASAQSSVQSDPQFQAALQKEMVDGNLKGAIEDYRAISARPGVPRGLASQALLRMAEVHQKLGNPSRATSTANSCATIRIRRKSPRRQGHDSRR